MTTSTSTLTRKAPKPPAASAPEAAQPPSTRPAPVRAAAPRRGPFVPRAVLACLIPPLAPTAVGLPYEVTLSYRGRGFDRAKDRNVAKLEAAERAGRLRVLRESAVTRIGERDVTLEVEGRSVTLPNDDVIARIGGEPPSAFLAKLGVRTVTKEIPLQEAKEAVRV